MTFVTEEILNILKQQSFKFTGEKITSSLAQICEVIEHVNKAENLHISGSDKKILAKAIIRHYVGDEGLALIIHFDDTIDTIINVSRGYYKLNKVETFIQKLKRCFKRN